MNTTKCKNIFLFLLFISSNSYAGNSSCEFFFKSCFENIPTELITYYYDTSEYGAININNVNLRDIPIISKKYSKILKKINKYERVEIKKVFFLKVNSNIKLNLVNSDNAENINNHRFGKWYYISQNDTNGFVFSEFVNIDKMPIKYNRYRHIDSIDWTKNKLNLQKNIEITLNLIEQGESYQLNGYAWSDKNGFLKITEVLKKKQVSKEVFSNDTFKLFLFDKDEMYLESETKIFTGIYKKY